jgi:hypothetical protein
MFHLIALSAKGNVLMGKISSTPMFADRFDARRRIYSELCTFAARADDGARYTSTWLTEIENAWRLAEAGLLPFTDEIKFGRFERSIQSFADALDAGSLPVAGMERPRVDVHAALEKPCKASLSATDPMKRYAINLMISSLSMAYAYGIPNRAVLDAIMSFSGGKVIEIGAGHGYWAMLLRHMGADMLAYDRGPGHWTSHTALKKLFGSEGDKVVGYVKEPWSEVATGTEAKLANASPDRTLLMVWPRKHDYASNALRLFRGERVVYVGEPCGLGCAEDEFFAQMQAWSLTEVIDIPRLPWHEDRAFFYQR